MLMRVFNNRVNRRHSSQINSSIMSLSKKVSRS
ncbi:MAG: hypothetical protein ACI96N_003259, partial [Arenicella sp.]